MLVEGAATCNHSSGRKWPQVFPGHREPLCSIFDAFYTLVMSKLVYLSSFKKIVPFFFEKFRKYFGDSGWQPLGFATGQSG